MSGLDPYLDEKRRALAARSERIRQGIVSPVPLTARATVEGRSGVRRIGIRRHAVVTDSLPDFAGSDLGPGSPADPTVVQALQARVEAACPILNLLRLPQAVSGRFTYAAPAFRADALLEETIA